MSKMAIIISSNDSEQPVNFQERFLVEYDKKLSQFCVQDDPNGPSVGWARWGDKPFGNADIKRNIRDCGYAMWDYKRYVMSNIYWPINPWLKNKARCR
jgi:hypothetical protein